VAGLVKELFVTSLFRVMQELQGKATARKNKKKNKNKNKKKSTTFKVPPHTTKR
jgi:hypothetical protein